MSVDINSVNVSNSFTNNLANVPRHQIGFELTSQFRDRNRNQKIGKFNIEASSNHKDKNSALDPVCLSAPMKKWKAGFSLTGNILSVSANERLSKTTLVISVALDDQGMTLNFYSGCILTSATDANMNERVIKSSAIDSNSLQIELWNNLQFVIGQSVTITDTTSFSPLHIRAPGFEDISLNCTILYNEDLNSYLNINGFDNETRILKFVETSAPGWLVSHNLTLRSETPILTSQLISITGNTITLSQPIEQYNIGNWIRARNPDYSVQQEDWSRKIYGVSGAQVTVFPPPPVTAPGTVIEILNFSYDNAYPIAINETILTMIFDVTLESLSIPNIEYEHGSIESVPYVWVGLQNQKAVITNKNVINSNNPHVTQSVFFAKLKSTSKLNNTFAKFYVCDTNQQQKRLIINLSEPLCVVVWLPNGQVLSQVELENQSPAPSWIEKQVWAIFSMDPIIGTNISSSGRNVY